MKRSSIPFKGILWAFANLVAILAIVNHEILAQTVTPAKVPEPLVVATAGKTANFTCESFGNPLNLCIWEKFNVDKSKPSTLISFNENSDPKNSTSLPGYFFHGSLKDGVCGLYLDNVTQLDMAQWQCTLFSQNLVYRELVTVKVVKKPQPPKFTPEDLGNIVDGVAVGSNGSALTCYSAHGLPPPTFKFFLGDEEYLGDLYPINTTTDAEGNTYTYQQLRNQRFTWRENGKKLRCVLIHDMLEPEDVKETSVYINVKFKPRAEQNSKNVYIAELGHPVTPLEYPFYANPKPRIYWEVDGVRISAGFSSPDRRIESLLLEETGPSTWLAKLRIRDMNRKDLRRRYVLKTENDVGRQDFEICTTQTQSREGATCLSQTQGLFLHQARPKPTEEPEDVDSIERSDLGLDSPATPVSVLEKLKQVQQQMQVLKEQESRLQIMLNRMKAQAKDRPSTSSSSRDGRKLKDDNLDSASELSLTASSPRIRTQPRILIASPDKSAADGLEFSEVKVESPGLYVRRKPL